MKDQTDERMECEACENEATCWTADDVHLCHDCMADLVRILVGEDEQDPRNPEKVDDSGARASAPEVRSKPIGPSYSGDPLPADLTDAEAAKLYGEVTNALPFTPEQVERFVRITKATPTPAQMEQSLTAPRQPEEA